VFKAKELLISISEPLCQDTVIIPGVVHQNYNYETASSEQSICFHEWRVENGENDDESCSAVHQYSVSLLDDDEGNQPPFLSDQAVF